MPTPELIDVFCSRVRVVHDTSLKRCGLPELVLYLARVYSPGNTYGLIKNLMNLQELSRHDHCSTNDAL